MLISMPSEQIAIASVVLASRAVTARNVLCILLIFNFDCDFCLNRAGDPLSGIVIS